MYRTAWRTGARVILLLLAAITLSSCHWPQWPSEFGRAITICIPFVESVESPQSTTEVHVGDPITFHLVFSTQSRPGLLSDPLMVWGQCGASDARYDDVNFFVIRGEDTLSPSYAVGPPGQQQDVTRYADHPGPHRFHFGTMRTREAGGTAIESGSVMAWYNTSADGDLTYREVVINVLP